jgi:hypothetical protein
MRLLFIGLLFAFFFDRSKHLPLVAKSNPFADDPYDAIGSIAVQLVLFLVLISLLRAFRPYPGRTPSARELSLIPKASLFGMIAICITLLGDLVAMVRHRSIWVATLGGELLAAATVTFFLIGVLELWLSWRRAKGGGARSDPWTAGLASTALVFVILAIYPEQLRQSSGGELLTALAGTAMLFFPLGVFSRRLTLNQDGPAVDIIDDLAAVVAWIKSRTPSLQPLYVGFDRCQRMSWALKASAWVNPRRHKWRLCLLTGAGVGIGLVTAEFWSEGAASLRMAVLLIAIFVGLESAAILMGYALLGKPLDLFRGQDEYAA